VDQNKTDIMAFDERLNKLDAMSDDELQNYQFALVRNPGRPDEYPADLRTFGTPNYYNNMSVRELQEALWLEFNNNPLLNSSVRDYVGRMCGQGFETYSEIPQIQEKIDEIYYDYRNRLHTMLPKYIGRSNVEGELFVVLTVHTDGFVEIDFRDPSTLDHIGTDDSGIIFHPTKPSMPIAYQFVYEGEDNKQHYELIPSIYVARYPELIKYLEQHPNYMESYLKQAKDSRPKYKNIGGFKKFVVQWDKGWLTTRNLSHIRTVLTWMSYYNDLKRYEIEHKKSSGSYLWVIEVEDPKAFRSWLALTPEQKESTGVMAKKDAGGTLMLPPGMKLKSVNPQLPRISDSDTDILDLVSAGLNTTDDVMMGRSNRNKSSLDATKGTQTDRIADQIAELEKFLRFDFWGNILFLASKVSSFKYEYKVKKAVDFDKNKEPIFKFKKYTAEHLVNFTFPVSQNADLEGMSRALLGVKHGALNACLGVPNEEIARRLGFSSYKEMRLKQAQENVTYPELQIDADAETEQENQIENEDNTQDSNNDNGAN
jgi:hypothetical protein